MILYATCTVNRLFLAPYGADPALTPALASFARRATVFPRHLTESGQSGLAYASLFTGLHSDRHGVYRHPSMLATEVRTIFEHFRDGGWDTLAFLDQGMASAELGYARGARSAVPRKLVADDEEFERVLGRLREDPDYRALVVTNFTVTHAPYRPGPLDAFCARHPERCRIRAEDPEAFARYQELHAQAHGVLSYDFEATRERLAMDDHHLGRFAAVVELLYRANIAYLDHLFGELLLRLDQEGLGPQTVVAFTADHGETLFREGTLFKWTHGHQLAPEVLMVPWVLSGPGVQVGRYPQVTRSVDVFPTLAGLAGLDSPEGLEGVDLSAVLHLEQPAPALDAFSHTSLLPDPLVGPGKKWGLFHAYHPRVDPELMWAQLVRGDRVVQLRRVPEASAREGRAGLRPAVFDLASDPWLEKDLYDPFDVGQRADLRDLSAYRRRLVEAFGEWAARGQGVDDRRQEELLRSLGYLPN